MTVRRSRAVPVPPDDVWAVVADPHHLPRWWPLTERVEAVDADAWTSVMRSDRGKVVRADYRVEATSRRDGAPGRRRWRGPRSSGCCASTARRSRSPGGGGTVVTLTVTQRGRGTARLGMWMMRRATRQRLDEALDGLTGALT